VTVSRHHRRLLLRAGAASVFALFVACSSSKNEDGAKGSGSKSGGASADGSIGVTTDLHLDGGATSDGSGPPAPGEPAVQLVGRFDLSTPTAPKAAWPGVRIVARFDGTAVSAKVGSAVGRTWINIVVDGNVTSKVELASGIQDVELATGLPAGVHVVEIEKRTEPNAGTLGFVGFMFPNGGKLLEPPARKSRRIEVLSDSTVDGYGIDGDVATTCGADYNPALDDVRKSTAVVLASKLDAEPHVIASSGKGIVQNEPGDDGEHFPVLYTRTLPDVPGSTWDFASWTPDVVVITLGGSDMIGETPAAGFGEAYDALVTSIRARHPAAHIYMTVWSQIKDLGPGQNLRTGLRTALEAVKAAHPGDAKLHVFQWTEADYPIDETGCAEHANAAHAVETANEISTVIRSDLGWN
jgi:hypothetical protein